MPGSARRIRIRRGRSGLRHGAHIQIEGKIQHSEYKGVKTDTIRVTSILKLDRAERVAAEDEFEETFDEDVAA